MSDVALLLRARIVELGSLGGAPATLASWTEERDTIGRLAYAAGDHGGGDSTLDGVTVTVEGAVGTLPPIGGTWQAAAHAAGATSDGKKVFVAPQHPPPA